MCCLIPATSLPSLQPLQGMGQGCGKVELSPHYSGTFAGGRFPWIGLLVGWSWAQGISETSLNLGRSKNRSSCRMGDTVLSIFLDLEGAWNASWIVLVDLVAFVAPDHDTYFVILVTVVHNIYHYIYVRILVLYLIWSCWVNAASQYLTITVSLTTLRAFGLRDFSLSFQWPAPVHIHFDLDFRCMLIHGSFVHCSFIQQQQQDSWKVIYDEVKDTEQKTRILRHLWAKSCNFSSRQIGEILCSPCMGKDVRFGKCTASMSAGTLRLYSIAVFGGASSRDSVGIRNLIRFGRIYLCMLRGYWAEFGRGTVYKF